MPETRSPGPGPGARSHGGRRETRELRFLYKMAGVLGRSLQVAGILHDVLEAVEELLHIPWSAAYLIEERGEERSFHLAASRGLDAEAAGRLLVYHPGEDTTRLPVLEKRPLVATLHDAGTDRLSRAAREIGIRSAAVVPLVSRGRVLGVLLAAVSRPEILDEETLELLQALGPDLGVAIENAQLFELVQRGRNEWLATFDSVEDRLAVLDAGLRIQRANRALIQALGLPPSRIIGRSCREIFPETCAGECPHQAARNGTRIETEARSASRLLRVVCYPGHAGGVIHVAKDITAEKEREEQLIQAEKLSAASMVLAGVAHEINNPLTVVIAYADLLSQLEESTPFRGELQQILRSALRCQSIVRNLLAFSRRDEPSEVEVDVNRLVRDTLPLFSYPFRLAGVRIEERLNPTIPPVAGDRNRLQQVLVNLLSNAQQAAGSHGGYLRIATRMRDGKVEIEVADAGSGIPAEVLPHVFEPFFTTKPPGQGTGLGLPLSLQIVRDHGGDIRVSSEPGHGATFVVSLPVRPAAPAGEEMPLPQPGALAGRRVLVVDDEPDVRSLVGAALGTFGAEVVTAASGREALARLEADSRFDVVFTDLRMPDMGGEELAAAIRTRWPQLYRRTLLTTGDVAATASGEIQHATGRPCLPKPFNVRELISSLQQVLDGQA